MPTVNIEAFSLALEAFAKAVGADQGKQIVLVVDQAGWHTSPQVRMPKGLHLALLPPVSPELQPAERLWPLTNEVIANRHFKDLAELDQALGERCCTLYDDRDTVRKHTSFHWWLAACSTH
jgi:hypothetical protein